MVTGSLFTKHQVLDGWIVIYAKGHNPEGRASVKIDSSPARVTHTLDQ